MPAGISNSSCPTASLNCRTSSTSPPGVTATTAQAPGCRTISRSPAGQSSTSTRIRLPRKASREASGCTNRLAGDGQRFLERSLPSSQGSADEFPEQRMRPGRPGLELGVELSGDEVGVVGQLDDLDQPPVR